MTYQIYYACDVKGCRNTEKINENYGGLNLIPEGWLVFYYSKTRIENDRIRIFVCYEHAKLFALPEKSNI